MKQSWPGIGCWFWTEAEFQPEGYKRFVDLYARHTGLGLLTTSIRHPVEVTDPAVHDQIKRAAEYARAHGLRVVMDLDVRLARQAFMDRYPDELQEIVRLRETPLGAGETRLTVESIELGDHYTFHAPPYYTVSSRLLRVYRYADGEGSVEPGSVEDITSRCRAEQADTKGITVSIPHAPGDEGRIACVMAAFALFTPDVFAPHLISFEQEILEQYADVPLAGACKDEWGFPGRFNPRLDDLWHSRYMAEVYAQRRPGRDLARDLLLMWRGEKGLEGERAAAINHYMEMNWQRNAEVETRFYEGIKRVFGPGAVSATHPTWYPAPSVNEVFKNGLSWWACRRDLAQTDEATPYCARTALAKKWRSPLWFNMYYSEKLDAYEEDIWRHVLGGGRMNLHPLYPRTVESLGASLLTGELMQAEQRIGLLNYISTAPIDCPVAVVFGHPAALNWAGAGFGEVGLELTNALWEKGYYVDLIPSSEIASGALMVDGDGFVWYGPQRYEAVVFFQPEFERAETAAFFRRAAGDGKTALFRVGEWTRDFEGRPFDGAAELPGSMKAMDGPACAREIAARLDASGVEPQTLCEMGAAAGFPPSMVPKRSGRVRLLDGTVIVASGEQEVMGDPIWETLRVKGHEIAFDAVGVAAIRLDEHGEVQALAAGGLKSVAAPGLRIELDTRADIALWRGAQGEWRGIIHGIDGPVPAALTAITGDWTRVRLPEPYDVTAKRF